MERTVECPWALGWFGGPHCESPSMRPLTAGLELEQQQKTEHQQTTAVDRCRAMMLQSLGTCWCCTEGKTTLSITHFLRKDIIEIRLPWDMCCINSACLDVRSNAGFVGVHVLEPLSDCF